MGALSYLFMKRLKNQFKQFFRQPSKIIFAVLLICCLGVTLLPGAENNIYHNYRSIDEFFAIISLLYAFMFVNVSKNGFSNGASLFSMADVNLIFPSPVKSSKVLFFGMLQQLGKSIYLGVFILFQYAVTREFYGISYGTLILVALGYGLTVLFAQMLSMLIYIGVGSSDKKVNIGKAVYYSVIALFALYVLLKADIFGGFEFSKLVSAIKSPLAFFMPVSGFVSAFVEGASTGDTAKLLFGAFSAVIFSVLYFVIVSRAKGDFYEDVLKATEVTYSAITASKEGKTVEAMPRNIKTGKIGFTKGFGADAIREKHKIENRRSNLFLLNRTSLVLVIMTVVYSFILSGSAIGTFSLSVYTMIVSVVAGRWARELTSPYVYLIPEKPFKKLLNLIYEQIPALISESILCFIPVHFIIGNTVTETVTMILGRISFGFLFIGTNLLLQRILGKSEKTAFSMMIYMIITSVLSLPSIVVGVTVGFMFPFMQEIVYLAMTAVNLIIAPVLLFISRNVLEYSEFNNR